MESAQGLGTNATIRRYRCGRGRRPEKDVIEAHAKHGDTGSPEVQVALLTARISPHRHFKEHKKDFQFAGLLAVGQRQPAELPQEKDIQRYRALIEKLGLRK
ncbi:MAG: 30S ribosomal protein S15 [Bilophila wadsworthia]